MKKIAIMGSGDGVIAEAIVKHLTSIENFQVEITCLSDNMNANILECAKNFDVKSKYLPFEQNGAYFAVNNFDLIILTGYQKELPDDVLNQGKFINIHPSLLPAFRGKDAVFRAYEAGVKVSGVTVHYVTSDIDGGKIIAQYPVLIGNLMHLDEFEKQIKQLAIHLYPIVIEKILKDEVFDFSDLIGCASCHGSCEGECH